MGINENSESGQKFLQEHGFTLIRSHLNISENLYLGSGLNSRPARFEIPGHANPCSCPLETGSKNKLRPLPTRTGKKFSSWKREISLDQSLTCQRMRKTLLGTKTRNAVWNICLNIALVSFPSQENNSENFNFNSGLISHRPHVISPIILLN